MSLLNFFTEKTKGIGLCSIELQRDGLAFAYVSDTTPPKPNVEICQFFPFQNQSKWQPIVRNLVEQNSLFETDCALVLSPQLYRLFLTNKPAVPPEEYVSAVHWQVKDMIDFPLEDAAVDIFNPAPAVRRYEDQLYVVVAQNSYLVNLAKLIKQTQLEPVAVDIREFAVRNLLTLMQPSKQMVAVLDMYNNHCLMLIIKEEQIYFSRKINYGLENLREGQAENNVYVEIQRSLDYFQSELKQTLPERFIFTPLVEEDRLLVENLAQRLGVHREIMDLNTMCNLRSKISVEQQVKCFVAVGGALRKEFN